MSRKLEYVVRFCLGETAFLAGCWFLEVPELPFQQWFPGSVFLGLAFGIWLGKSSTPNREISGSSAKSDGCNKPGIAGKIVSQGIGNYSACGGCSPESTSDYADCENCPHQSGTAGKEKAL